MTDLSDMDGLTIDVRRAPNGTVLAVSGELDFHSAEAFHTALRDLTPRPGEILVLDLGGLEFCDSSGITGFITARNRAVEAGARIALTGVPAHTARVLNIMGLDPVLPAHPTAEAALRADARPTGTDGP
ncbi:STAS domain-containing protein [Streptomyces sp. ST2-7A]|uniref:STAS domain-containing protein n=1 Tax=Streptomyces sp. ST2-7A TaxID=2907214 RepID=UPI001F22D7E7|nr:STAS domain-containing protein [Streptomyces sp. ST2-7A]MCE7079144.1 STAS domain-containing protein [Streptomyces sp. ST2-7A]